MAGATACCSVCIELRVLFGYWNVQDLLLRDICFESPAVCDGGGDGFQRAAGLS